MRVRDFAKFQLGRGSYMPVLMRIVQMTKGPIVELGAGYVSTPYLHWACFENKREIVTYENDPHWFNFAFKFHKDNHSVHFVEDWNKVDLSRQWEVAFVDHSPEDRRIEEIKKLTHVPYVVIHDTENASNSKYHFPSVHNLFKYRWKYSRSQPCTSVWSNSIDFGKECV